MQKKIWFKAKKYGYGWYPSTWQGWLVLFIWVIFFTISVTNMNSDCLMNYILILLYTTILIIICYKKGEKPEWRFGNKNNDQK